MPVDLQGLFQSDPAAQELGLGFLGQEKEMNQARLAQQLFQTERGKQMLPLELQQQSLANQTAQAQLPGIQAQSERQGLDTRFARETLQPKIEAEIAKYKGQMSDNQFKQLTNAGQAYMQAGPLLDRMPGVVTHAAAKQILGDFYRPEFDQIPANALGQVISNFGEAMVNAQAKYYQQVGITGMKTGSAERIAGGKNETELEKARIAAAAKMKAFDKDIIEAKAAAQAKYGNYPQNSSYYMAKAQEAFEIAATTDDEGTKQQMLNRARILGQIANERMQQDLAARAAAPTEANKSKPNLQGFGIDTVTPPGQAPGANIPGGGNNPTVAPSTQAPVGSPETFKKAFGAYEPDKYDYRIGPNGQPQRKKKQ